MMWSKHELSCVNDNVTVKVHAPFPSPQTKTFGDCFIDAQFPTMGAKTKSTDHLGSTTLDEVVWKADAVCFLRAAEGGSQFCPPLHSFAPNLPPVDHHACCGQIAKSFGGSKVASVRRPPLKLGRTRSDNVSDAEMLQCMPVAISDMM